jgi:hypothetical protein
LSSNDDGDAAARRIEQGTRRRLRLVRGEVVLCDTVGNDPGELVYERLDVRSGCGGE